jgi:hypothetical protein
MCSTTLGAGVTPPFEYLYSHAGMIFASAVSDDFKTMMRRAAFEFNQSTATTDMELRRRVHRLENDLTNGTSGSQDVLQDLEEARAELQSKRYPFCHDHSAAKDLILDMVHKSRHGHVAVLDDRGFRLSIAMQHIPSLSRECALLHTTASFMMDQSSIRIHGTGASTDRYVAAGKSAAFTYFSSPSPAAADKLITKLGKKTTLTTLRGHAVIIADAPLHQPTLTINPEGLLKMLNTYYVLGHKRDDDKAAYVMEAYDEWEDFLSARRWMDTLAIPENRRQRADLISDSFHIKPKVAAAFAVRAALCQAVIDNSTGNHMKIPATRQHLQLAIEFFKVLLKPMEVRLRLADKQADNAAKARAARNTLVPSPSRQEDAMEALREAIIDSGKNMISRDAARRLPRVTVALLDYLAANNDDIVELVGTEQIKMGKTSRAYTLRSLISHDLQESKDELSDATIAYATDPHAPAFDDMQVVRHEIMRLAAEAEKGDYGLPAVPITKMSPRQLRCLPAILNEFSGCFVMRGTPEKPELPHLVKTVTDPTAPLDPDTPVVWVRRNVEGRDFRDWVMAARLGFSEIWNT